MGVLSGWDCIRFMGTLRMLSCLKGMMGYLSLAGVPFKDFGGLVEHRSDEVKEAIQARANPPVPIATSLPPKDASWLRRWSKPKS